MRVIETKLPGVLLIMPRVFEDERGFFMEIFHEARYAENAITGPWRQDNLSYSKRGVLRGLHYQNPEPQGKLVSVVAGEVWDVAVDIRQGSPTFGKWHGEILSAENHRQLWVPEGFAHGFVVLSEEALFSYKCTSLYKGNYDSGIRWDDPEIAIEWPITNPLISPKDANLPFLSVANNLPIFRF
ncbi:MAG: dTDP-4-dehydrorhamnose 3,5-epimerase [Fimbriimonadaceae bacterium]|jgi:dTDP-4-dehydrorhamnose 3,5-epimerase|nr:dTDP-4-dehydrorhamnose 3,5-epimerase [Fimbriimonadaceae bacterium]